MIKGGFPAPSVIHVESSDKTYIRGKFATKKDAIPGDVVYMNREGDIKIVRQGAIGTLGVSGLPNDYTAQAIVVIPKSHINDALGCDLICCSIGAVTNNYGERGVCDWTYSDCSDAFLYSGSAVYEDNIATSSVTFGINALNSNILLLPSDSFTGDLCQTDMYTRYSTEKISGGQISRIGYYCPSPYYEDDKINREYTHSMFMQGKFFNVLGVTGAEPQADGDALSLTNTILSNATLGATSAISMVSQYHSDYLAQGWYLPSIRELAYFCNRYGAISTTISKLGGSPLITSEMPIMSVNGFINDSTPYIWALDMSDGSLKNLDTTQSHDCFVFAFIRI